MPRELDKTERDALGTSSPAATKRRSPRVLLAIAVTVTWTSAGVRVQEPGETIIVNRHGALVKMETMLPLGTEVELSRAVLHQSVKAKVVGVYERGEDGKVRAAMELHVPAEGFWGISLPA